MLYDDERQRRALPQRLSPGLKAVFSKIDTGPLNAGATVVSDWRAAMVSAARKHPAASYLFGRRGTPQPFSRYSSRA